MLPFVLLFTSLAACLVSAQNVVDNLSFGHKQGISTNSFSVPGFSVLGEGYVPQIMSDKVILTPPYGGGKRGALWSQAKSQSKDWAVTMEFRAGGVDNGKGNLQLWYARDGEHTVGTASVYTTRKFDGLVVVVDTNAGVQKIRGFLNDGTTDYSNHANVDGLAFGHCNHNYRNLGRPSKLEVKATSSALDVLIDGKKCFSTTKVTLPTDYNFGMTAASNEPPDSFEVFKFEARTVPAGATHIAPPVLNHQGSSKEAGDNSVASSTQFQDVNKRLDQLSKSVQDMFDQITKRTKAEEQRYQEVLRQLPSSSAIGGLESRLSNLDRLIAELTAELKGGNHKEQFTKIAAQLQETHQSLTHHLPSTLRDYVQNHTPRIGFIVFSFMAFQSCCLAFLLWQKWRKSTMPKKFL